MIEFLALEAKGCELGRSAVSLQGTSEPGNNREIVLKELGIGIMEIFGTCSVDS